MENLKELKEFCDEYLDVDFEKGKIFWKKGRPGATVGQEAGYIDSNGYRVIKIKSKRYYVHRLLWFLYYGYFPENQIDHIDGDRLNNSISNLREVSNSCNQQNQKESKNNTSGFIGVCYNKSTNKYKAQITIRNKDIYLGYYFTSLEAAYARGAYEILHPDWTCNYQGTIFKQIAESDKTFDYERFESDVTTYGFEFSNKRITI